MNPSYLWNRNNKYYFRIRIPKEYQPHFQGRSELRKALSTSDKSTALRLSYPLFLQVSEVFESMKKQGFDLFTVNLGNGASVDIDTGNPDKDREQAKKLLEDVGVISSTDRDINLPDLVEEYCQDKLKENAWTPKSEQENRAIYDLFLRIVGSKKLNINTARGYRDTLLSLPPNLNKRFKGKTIQEVLDMKPSPMSATSVNKHLNRVSSLMKWAVKFQYIDNNYFEGLTVARRTKASEERQAFTQADIDLLFSSEIYSESSYRHPYYYWLPLIGLYSGLRIEETCQLHLEDIRSQENDVWIFDVNDKGEKKLKNKSSSRLVPIHSKLIALGFLDYVDNLRPTSSRVFPELKKQRDGYSQAASKWFGRYRKKIGLEPVFHSFRHTVANELKQKGIDRKMVAELLGHSVDDMTFGRYGKAFSPSVLQEVVEKLDYTIPNMKTPCL